MSEDPILFVKKNLNVPIILVGMMGVGKTSIGQGLAQKLGWGFKDSDRVIEQKAGMPVSDIFTDFGEEKFRASEKSTILELLKEKPQVIATGGGAVLDEDTRYAIKNRALSIWLQADIDYIYERVSKNNNRPLLQTDNPLETLSALMEKRRVYYENADLQLDTTKNSIDESVYELIKLIYGFLSRH